MSELPEFVHRFLIGFGVGIVVFGIIALLITAIFILAETFAGWSDRP